MGFKAAMVHLSDLGAEGYPQDTTIIVVIVVVFYWISCSCIGLVSKSSGEQGEHRAGTAKITGPFAWPPPCPFRWFLKWALLAWYTATRMRVPDIVPQYFE